MGTGGGFTNHKFPKWQLVIESLFYQAGIGGGGRGGKRGSFTSSLSTYSSSSLSSPSPRVGGGATPSPYFIKLQLNFQHARLVMNALLAHVHVNINTSNPQISCFDQENLIFLGQHCGNNWLPESMTTTVLIAVHEPQHLCVDLTIPVLVPT